MRCRRVPAASYRAGVRGVYVPRLMSTPWDVVLALVIVVGLPLRALFGYRRLQAAPGAELPALRPRLYLRAIASQWTLAGAVLALWVWQRRAWGDLGLDFVRSLTLVGILAGLAIVVPAVWRQRSQVAKDPELRARVRERLAGAIRLMPTNDAEHRLFHVLAVTAGVCEELLFRGYLVWFVSQYTSILLAHGLVAVAFGAGHAYQGPRGMLRTGFAGAFFSGLVLLTGMVWPAMVVHAGMDLLAGDLSRRAAEPAPAGEAA